LPADRPPRFGDLGRRGGLPIDGEVVNSPQPDEWTYRGIKSAAGSLSQVERARHDGLQAERDVNPLLGWHAVQLTQLRIGSKQRKNLLDALQLVARQRCQRFQRHVVRPVRYLHDVRGPLRGPHGSARELFIRQRGSGMHCRQHEATERTEKQEEVVMNRKHPMRTVVAVITQY
jgi:hypothetical protein